MKSNTFVEAVDEIVKLKMEIADEYISEVVDAIGDVGNPEKLIGKPYSSWTPMDLQTLGKIYGNGNDSPLAKLIFNKEYDFLQKLEKGVG
jgi:hypothetical protein